MDLSRYIEIEAACRVSINDVNGMIVRVRETAAELEQLETRMQDELSSITSNKTDYVSRSISEKIYSCTNHLSLRKQSLTAELKTLKSKPYTPNRQQIQQRYLKDIELYKDILKGTSQDRKNNKVLFEIVQQQDTVDASKISVKQIRTALQNYQTGFIKVKQFQEFSMISNKLIGRLFKASALFKYLKGWHRLAFLFSFYGAVALGMLLCMPLIVLSYIKLSLHFLKDAEEFRNTQINGISQIARYETLARELKQRIADSVNKIASEETQEFVEHKSAKVKVLRKEIDALTKEITQAEKSVKDEMTTYSKTDNYEKEQDIAIRQRYKDQLEELSISLEESQMLLKEMQSNQAMLIEQRDTGKKELEQRYFNLDTVGESKILPTEFLLGFNEYIPITLDMPDYCINLLANQKSLKPNVDFVIMCLVQILCTTNPSCIKLSIVDINNGTTHFGIFSNLPDIITVIKTPEELSDKLDSLFLLKAERDRDIKQKADDITAYNQIMIDNYGLTIPYEILIVTHHIEQLVESSIYRQLQHAGDLGIVTITMWDNTILRYNPRIPREKYMKIVPFISELANVMYYGSSGDLTTLSAAYIDEKLGEIKRMLRSTK